MAGGDTKGREGAQGLLALVGITLGLVPLVKVALGGDVGWLLDWVPSTDASPGRWLVPLIVVVVCAGAVLALERRR